MLRPKWGVPKVNKNPNLNFKSSNKWAVYLAINPPKEKPTKLIQS